MPADTKAAIRRAVLADRESLRQEFTRRLLSLREMTQANDMPLLVKAAHSSILNVRDEMDRIEKHWRKVDRDADRKARTAKRKPGRRG